MSTNEQNLESPKILLKRVAYYRMIANLHIMQGLILESEKDAYIQELCESEQGEKPNIVSRFIDGVLDSRLGMLLLGNLMGVSNKIYNSMAVGDEREAKMAEIEMAMLDNLKNRQAR